MHNYLSQVEPPLSSCPFPTQLLIARQYSLSLTEVGRGRQMKLNGIFGLNTNIVLSGDSGSLFLSHLYLLGAPSWPSCFICCSMRDQKHKREI